MKITLPNKDNELEVYNHYDSQGELDYSFENQNGFINSIKIYKNNIKYFVLPQIDYEDRDAYLDNRDLRSVDMILNKDLSNMSETKRGDFVFLQNYLIKCLTVGKTAIGSDVLKEINASASSSKPANIVFTGNACAFILSEEDLTTCNININLILPSDMGMYRVTIFRYNYNESFVVFAPKIIETNIENTHEKSFNVQPIDNLELGNFKLSVDQTKYFNRNTNEIVKFGRITTV